MTTATARSRITESAEMRPVLHAGAEYGDGDFLALSMTAEEGCAPNLTIRRMQAPRDDTFTLVGASVSEIDDLIEALQSIRRRMPETFGA